MSARYDAAVIAKWFIAWAETEAFGISNYKLQSLVYFAQSRYRARYGTPLFDGPIEPSSDHPAVKAAYDAYVRSGPDPVEVDPDTARFLTEIGDLDGPYVDRLAPVFEDQYVWSGSLAELAEYVAHRGDRDVAGRRGAARPQPRP